MIMQADFSIDELVMKMKKSGIGAIVTYIGMVRGEEGEIKGMKIEVSDDAETGISNLKSKALEKFSIEEVEIIHRKGSLKAGDNIALILVGAKHRKEAFRACEYIIDALKKIKAVRRQELRSR